MLLVHKKLCQAQIGRFSKKNFNLYIFSQKFQNCVLRYICLKMRFFSFLKSYIYFSMQSRTGYKDSIIDLRNFHILGLVR